MNTVKAAKVCRVCLYEGALEPVLVGLGYVNAILHAGVTIFTPPPLRLSNSYRI